MTNNLGFQSDFIGGKLTVKFPKLSTAMQREVALANNCPNGELRYPHFSIFLSRTRKFPFFTATNINGSLFKKATRSDNWTIDDRAPDYQWGDELYKAKKSDFDKGHMTKREDPQWGANSTLAQQAADATFHFSNSVPQVPDLNRQEWKQLEDYILAKESVPGKLLISVFTGPVLKDDDPVFVTKVHGQDVLLPTLFWKVVYYSNDGTSLSKVGFLMGQENLLVDNGIARPQRATKIFAVHAPKAQQHFMAFKDAETYQVNVATIETLTGLRFSPAAEPFKDNRPSLLIIKEVELKQDHAKAMAGVGGTRDLHVGNFHYQGLVLR